jgi:DNA-binding NarL/FixJ family response regulator
MRIAIADDATIIRDGLAQLLTLRNIEVVAAVGDADALRAALDLAARLLGGARPGLDALTPRETQVLALMSEGRTNSAIARRLTVTDLHQTRPASVRRRPPPRPARPALPWPLIRQ